MRRFARVEVARLDHESIAHHRRLVNAFAAQWIVLVAIDALEKYRLTVDEQLLVGHAHLRGAQPAALPLYVAATVDHPASARVHATAVDQTKAERVQVRRLGRPQVNIGQRHANREVYAAFTVTVPTRDPRIAGHRTRSSCTALEVGVVVAIAAAVGLHDVAAGPRG